MPQALQLGAIGRTVGDDEAIAGNVFLTGRDFPIAQLRGSEAEKWFGRMQSHRLRRAEIIRVAEDRDASHRAVHVAADVAPSSARFVARETIRFTVRREPESFVFAIPLRIAAETDRKSVV